jgi:DNA-binding transcriptional LysR family regulator
MDLRRLKTFVAVAELGTVSKAAVHLRIGQPALSRQIGDLQRELGLCLFDRVGRRLVLTAQGEQLLVDCRRVLTDFTTVRERADVLRRGDSGVLKVLAPPHTIESVLFRRCVGRRCRIRRTRQSRCHNDREACLLPALAAIRLFRPPPLRRSLPPGKSPSKNSAGEPRITHADDLGRGWARCGDHPLPSAN